MNPGNWELPDIGSLSLADLPAVNVSPVILPSTQDQLPVLSLPALPSSQLPALPSSQLPTLPSSSQLPTLPSSSQLPALPSSTLPGLSSSTLPGLPILPSNELGSYVPTMLADNEIGILDWMRADPPDYNYKRIGCIGDGTCFFHAICKALSEIYQLTYIKPTTISEELLSQFETHINNPRLFVSTIFSPARTARTKQPGKMYHISNQYRYEMAMVTFRTQFAAIFRQEFAQLLQTNQNVRQIVANRLPGETEVNMVLMEGGPIVDPALVYQYAFQTTIMDLVNELVSLHAVDARYALILSDLYDVDIYVLTDSDIRDPQSKNTVISLYYNTAVRGPSDMRPENDPQRDLPDRSSIVIINVNGGHFELVGYIDPSTGNRQTSFGPNDPFIRLLYSNLSVVRSI